MQKFKLFSASWCNPCSVLKKWVVSKELGERVEVVDIDQHPELVAKHRVRGVPCLVGSDNELVTGLENIKRYLEE